jgi:hypothetical protein
VTIKICSTFYVVHWRRHEGRLLRTIQFKKILFHILPILQFHNCLRVWRIDFWFELRAAVINQILKNVSSKRVRFKTFKTSTRKDTQYLEYYGSLHFAIFINCIIRPISNRTCFNRSDHSIARCLMSNRYPSVFFYLAEQDTFNANDRISCIFTAAVKIVKKLSSKNMNVFFNCWLTEPLNSFIAALFHLPHDPQSRNCLEEDHCKPLQTIANHRKLLQTNMLIYFHK